MQTWDPLKFIINVHGNIIRGFAEGSVIKAMRNEDAYMLKIGADGRGARMRNANRSGRFEISLLASSPDNATLQAIAINDELTGTGVGATQVKDGGGTGVGNAQNSWVVKIPDLERQKEIGDVTWIIETDLLELTQGGTLNA